MPPALFLLQYVYFRLEFRVRRDRARLRQYLTPLHSLFVDPPQQYPYVVPRHRIVQQLPEHFKRGRYRLYDVPLHSNYRDFFPSLDLPTLDPARHYRPASRDRENVLYRHQERLVHFPHRIRYEVVARIHQLPDAFAHGIVFRPLPLFHDFQRRSAYDRDVVSGEVVFVQKFPYFHFHKVQQLRIVYLVRLVHEYHNRRNVHLTRKQHVLPRLRHRSVSSGHHQDRSVHLRRSRDHVLDVVRMSRAVDVRIMPLLRLVFHVRYVDRYPALPLFRRLVYHVVRRKFRQARRRQTLRDRRRQCRLPMVYVPYRPYVQMRLRS